jgi:colicin import membrane protein
MHVTRAWVLPAEFRNQPLETLLMVEVGPNGEVGRVRITESSGNPFYDENVERALQKATPLPAPPRADDFEFSFRPDDAR